MSNRAGLHIGRSFLELTVKKGTQIVSRRITYSLNSLDSQLRSLILAVGGLENMDRIDIRSRLPWQAIEKQMGIAPALFTTTGLESWLDLNLPLFPETWSANLKRASTPLSSELVFGFTERTSAEGKIETPASESELEFLVSKLKLNEVKNIAIAFLHSRANPANEKAAAEYFRAQGFHVHASHETSNDNEERPRFLSAVLSAYVDPFLKEKMELVLKVMTDAGVQPEVVNYGPQTLLKFLEGPRLWLDYDLQSIDLDEDFLYCGIDDLELFCSHPLATERTMTSVGAIGVRSAEDNLMLPSLLARLEINFFGSLDWAPPRTATPARVDIEPGPACLGRAHAPALIDAIVTEFDLTEVDGLKDRLNEKTLKKVKDIFKTYSRTENVVDEVVKCAAQMWGQKLAISHAEPLALRGPLATVVKKLFQDLGFGDQVGDCNDLYLSELLVQ